MKTNEGYNKIVAAIQKYFDQAISGNWSYNPEHYVNNEIPLSTMATDLVDTYKYGWKTSYYQNTYDSKKDENEDDEFDMEVMTLPSKNLLPPEDCESCTI